MHYSLLCSLSFWLVCEGHSTGSCQTVLGCVSWALALVSVHCMICKHLSGGHEPAVQRVAVSCDRCSKVQEALQALLLVASWLRSHSVPTLIFVDHFFVPWAPQRIGSALYWEKQRIGNWADLDASLWWSVTNSLWDFESVAEASVFSSITLSNMAWLFKWRKT